jgi:hypothetical protein
MITAEEATRLYAEREFNEALVHARIDIENHEGYKCCGGTDPNCHCSFAESDWQTFDLVGFRANGTYVTKQIGDKYTSFNEVLGNILAVGNESA